MRPNLRLIDLGTSCPSLLHLCFHPCLPAEGASNSRRKPGYDWRTCIYVVFVSSTCSTSSLPASLHPCRTSPVTSLAMIGVRASMQSAILQFDAHRA